MVSSSTQVVPKQVSSLSGRSSLNSSAVRPMRPALAATTWSRFKYLFDMCTARIPSGFRWREIEAKRFGRKQMNRDRVAGKSVHQENVKAHGPLPFKRQPRIAEMDLFVGRGELLKTLTRPRHNGSPPG
jgi:hypothetical protein